VGVRDERFPEVSGCGALNTGRQSPEPDGEAASHAVATLSPEERMLVVVCRELYESEWDEMIADMQARLNGEPYIFKLATRIEDDLLRIQRLRELEEQLGIALGDHVPS
jgi:hypothetical protein